jgi:hypothetical protein
VIQAKIIGAQERILFVAVMGVTLEQLLYFSRHPGVGAEEYHNHHTEHLILLRNVGLVSSHLTRRTLLLPGFSAR